MKNIVTDIVLKRCEEVDPEEFESTKQLCEKGFFKWENTGYQEYGNAGNSHLETNGTHPLMYSTSSEVSKNIQRTSLATPSSMRGVDTESQIRIINF